MNNDIIKKTILSDDTRGVLMTCVYGLVAALSAVGFLLGTNFIFKATIARLSEMTWPVFMLGSLCVVLITSAAAGWLLTVFRPDAAGSGIPQVKIGYWKDMGYVDFKGVLVKFAAGVLSLGGGTSLGREGPTVYVGAGTASAVAGQFGVVKYARRPAAAAGAAAGLSAAFNTPLAAITFVIEEIVGEMNARVMGGVVLASVIGAFVVHAIIGSQPAFLLPDVSQPGIALYIAVPVAAAVAAAIGGMFQHAVLQLRTRVKGVSGIPCWARPVVGGVATWALGVMAFIATSRIGVFGIGYGDLSDGMAYGMPCLTALLLVVCKLAATVMSYGWGGCGGIFSPTLFMGCMSGLAIGGIAKNVLHADISESDIVILGAVGMSACLCAVVRAPLTSLLIIFEMTHEFVLVPPLMISVLISMSVARLFNRHNFYEAILHQDGHDQVNIRPPRDMESWRNLPVSSVMKREPCVLEGTGKASLERCLRTPYSRFPVTMQDGSIAILLRVDAEQALRKASAPHVEPAIVSNPGQTIREISRIIVTSSAGMVVLVDPSTGKITGLITLHDLLRAQAAIME